MILVIDDMPEIASEHSDMLKALGFPCHFLTNPKKVIPYLKEHKEIDLVCLDLRMPHMGGLDLMAKINEFNPSIGIIIATVINDVREAVKAIRSGAYNYLLKPLQPESLHRVIGSYYNNRPLHVTGDERFSSFITRSDKCKDVFNKIKTFAQSNIPILITGETGTGKELIARLIHNFSPRHELTYLPVNISSLSTEIFQSELFGHVRGAFTGADKSRHGFFNQAEDGTLFLDEIGELPMAQQKNLLRVLQDGSFYPVGSSQANTATCRLIFATNRDLQKEVQAGRFREDLYYRICHASIELPPLRERPEDIECLAHYFLHKYCSQHGRFISELHPDTLDLLKHYHFQGNVRELEGMINVAVMLETTPQLRPDHLPKHVRQSPPASTSSLNLENVRMQTIQKALEETNQHQSKAAELLGISRTTLHRILNEKKD